MEKDGTRYRGGSGGDDEPQAPLIPHSLSIRQLHNHHYPWTHMLDICLLLLTKSDAISIQYSLSC